LIVLTSIYILRW